MSVCVFVCVSVCMCVCVFVHLCSVVHIVHSTHNGKDGCK